MCLFGSYVSLYYYSVYTIFLVFVQVRKLLVGIILTFISRSTFPNSSDQFLYKIEQFVIAQFLSTEPFNWDDNLKFWYSIEHYYRIYNLLEEIVESAR